MGLATLLTVACLLPLPTMNAATDAPQVSALADATARQSTRSLQVSRELQEMIRQSEDDPTVIITVGERMLAECNASIQLAENYRNAKTRFGLQNELDNFLNIITATREGTSSFQKLTGITGPITFSQSEIDSGYSLLREELTPLLSDLIDIEFEAVGVGDFLTDPGLDTAKSAVKSTLESELKSHVDQEISRVLGLRISVGHSLRGHLNMSARAWLNTKLRGLVFRFALNSFIVELIGKKILDWVGPRLREFLRHKGSLETRTQRTVGILRDREQQLHSFKSAEDLAIVRAHVESAEKHILQGNKYLRSDISAGNRDDLMKELVEAEKSLLGAIKLTKTRFLMNSALAQTNFADLVEHLTDLRDELASALSVFKQKNQKQETETAKSGVTSEAITTYRGNLQNLYNQDYWGVYTVYLTGSPAKPQARVVGPDGDVIENLSLTYRPNEDRGTLRLYDSSECKYPDGKSSRFAVTFILPPQNRRANYELTITLTWWDKDGKRLCALALRQVKN
ncbi:hypothetical protein QM565_37870 [Geitlerinema splendidum]|nr:hypothetical protein [Geitlerinema splendidum]